MKLRANQPPPPQVISRQSNPVPAAPAPNAGVSSVKAGAGAPRPAFQAPGLKHIFASLGLPVDKLSASVLSFARFFSLPLDPALLAKLRRQGLRAPPLQASQAGDKTSGRAKAAGIGPASGALSLAAVAAADKGLELSRAGLARFASALDPGEPLPGETPEQTAGQGLSPLDPDAGQERRDQADRGKEGRKRREDKGEGALKTGGAGADAGAPAAIREQFLAAEEKDPLLTLLNRLPGKNGRRWLALPLNFVEQGEEYRVCLRVLLAGGDGKAGGAGFSRAERMALDMVNTANGQRRLFILDSANGKNPLLRLLLSPSPPEGERKKLCRELSAALDIPRERVSVRPYSEDEDFAADSRDDLLRTINEAV